MIQEKINQGEGYIEVETLGIIPVKELDEKTNPDWDLTLFDYQEQINNIDLIFQDEKQRFQWEIDDLKVGQDKIKEEYNLDELKKIYIKLKEAVKIAENKPAPKTSKINPIFNDAEVVKITSQIDYINKGICGKLNNNQIEIENKEKELKEAEQRREAKMQEISNDLIAKRKPQNPDYLYYQGLKIINRFTKHDYKIIDDELVLLTDEEKLNIEKENKIKEIANQLNSLYPERLIDGTMAILYNEKKDEIESLLTIEDVKNYKVV